MQSSKLADQFSLTNIFTTGHLLNSSFPGQLNNYFLHHPFQLTTYYTTVD
jgi:hypothetical protein